ncbi:unnamed protein product [Umbelopsis vinacea]
MPRQRKRKQEIAEFDFEALPIAKCRDNGDEWPRRESKRITVDEAYSAVEEMLPRRLNIIIDSVLKSQAIRSLPPSEDDFFGEMEKTKFAILNAEDCCGRHTRKLQLPALSVEEDQEKPQPTKDGRIRTCVTMINRVLRQVLLRDHADITDLLTTRLQDTAVELTNMKSDLLAILQLRCWKQYQSNGCH